MSSKFRKKLIVEYQKDASWKAILDLLKRLINDETKNRASSEKSTTIEKMRNATSFTTILTSISASENRTTEFVIFASSTTFVLSSDEVTMSNKRSISDSTYLIFEIDFQLIDDFIYYVKSDQSRLCISKNCIHDVFKLAHDDNFHVDHHRAYDRLKTIYIRRLFRRFINYIRHCSSCQLNQIKRHKLYEELTSISIFNMSYHTISIDFVLVLFKQNHEFNCFMFVIDKFIRKTLLIYEKITWSIDEWADVLIDRLLLTNWNISAEIIFDRNRKFCFDLWRVMFKRLNISLFMSTIYHSQTNDQSKRTNQTIEIALRFLIVVNFDMSWMNALSAL